MSENETSTRRENLAQLELHYRALLEVLQPGIFSLDMNDIVISGNQSGMQLWGLSGAKFIGQRIQDSALGTKNPDLIRRLEESRRGPEAEIRFECAIIAEGAARSLAIHIRPVGGENAHRVGTLIHVEDVTSQRKLHAAIEQLDVTGAELQSAYEELETTNEELQTTNEELGTTNEELQSTNEELETTNEQLQSLNEELENMNEELEFRNCELDTLNRCYAETLERMPWPMAVLDSEGHVQFWNSAAHKLFDIPARAVVGLALSQLPIQPSLRDTLIQRRANLSHGKTTTVLRNQELKVGRSRVKFDVHLTPLDRDGEKPSLLLMFAPQETAKQRSNSRGVKPPPKTAPRLTRRSRS